MSATVVEPKQNRFSYLQVVGFGVVFIIHGFRRVRLERLDVVTSWFAFFDVVVGLVLILIIVVGAIVVSFILLLFGTVGRLSICFDHNALIHCTFVLNVVTVKSVFHPCVARCFIIYMFSRISLYTSLVHSWCSCLTVRRTLSHCFDHIALLHALFDWPGLTCRLFCGLWVSIGGLTIGSTRGIGGSIDELEVLVVQLVVQSVVLLVSKISWLNFRVG